MRAHMLLPAGLLAAAPGSAQSAADSFGSAASARATMAEWVDYLELANMDRRWAIVEVLWERTP